MWCQQTSQHTKPFHIIIHTHTHWSYVWLLHVCVCVHRWIADCLWRSRAAQQQLSEQHRSGTKQCGKRRTWTIMAASLITIGLGYKHSAVPRRRRLPHAMHQHTNTLPYIRYEYGAVRCGAVLRAAIAFAPSLFFWFAVGSRQWLLLALVPHSTQPGRFGCPVSVCVLRTARKQRAAAHTNRRCYKHSAGARPSTSARLV